MIKNALLFLLVALPPAGYFFGFYFVGLGIISQGSGLMIGAFSMFLLPFLVSAGVARWTASRLLTRVLVVVATLVIQFGLVFSVPAGARSEMMGIARRQKKSFDLAEIKICAEGLLQKKKDGTFSTNSPPDKYNFLIPAIFIAGTELPEKLKGKFDFVAIKDDASGSRVYFETETQTGIMFNTNAASNDYFEYKLSDGVYDYHYQRL